MRTHIWSTPTVNSQPPGAFARRTNIIAIALGTAYALMIPLVAMQFTDDVQWSAIDFLVAGALLVGTGLIFTVAMRKFRKHQIIAGVVIAIAFTSGRNWPSASSPTSVASSPASASPWHQGRALPATPAATPHAPARRPTR
jgi:hypothetical protein